MFPERMEPYGEVENEIRILNYTLGSPRVESFVDYIYAKMPGRSQLVLVGRMWADPLQFADLSKARRWTPCTCLP